MNKVEKGSGAIGHAKKGREFKGILLRGGGEDKQ